MSDKSIEEAKKQIEKEQFNKAEDILENIIAKRPEDSSAFFELGKVCLVKKDYVKATYNLKKALRRAPSHKDAKLLLAKAYKSTANTDESINLLKELLEAGYEGENLAYELFSLHKELEDDDNALKYLKMALDKGLPEEQFKRDYFKIAKRKIMDLNKQGHYTDALREIKKVADKLQGSGKKVANILLAEEEIARKKIILKSRPRSLNVILTHKCNIRCIMCRTPNMDSRASLPSGVKDEIVELLPYVEKVVWQGGEPFLYRHLEELVDSAHKNKVAQNIITNGLLIPPRFARKLVKFGVELTFSVDGATKEVFEKIRRGASWEKLLAKINLINELRKQMNPEMCMSMNVLIMPSNYTQVTEFIEFAHRYDFKRVFFNSVDSTDLNRNFKNLFDYGRDKKKLLHIKDLFEAAEDIAREYGIEVENWFPVEGCTTAEPAENKEGIGENKTEEFCEEQTESSSDCSPPESAGHNSGKLFCHVPWQRMFIDPSLTVLPDCQCISPIGSLKDNSLMELWNSEKMMLYREKIIKEELEGFCSGECIHGKVSPENLKEF